MRWGGIMAQWAPMIIERLIDLVDADLMREVLTQAIEKMKERIVETETSWDDRVLLPLLEILKLVVEEPNQR